jgi:hypothetical protein
VAMASAVNGVESGFFGLLGLGPLILSVQRLP